MRKKELYFAFRNFTEKNILYNKPNYSRIFIGSHQELMNYGLFEDRRTDCRGVSTKLKCRNW